NVDAGTTSVAIMPTPRDEREESMPAFARKKAALLAQVGRYEFDPKGFEVIEGEPIVYWWTKEFLKKYAEAPKLGERTPARQGLITGDMTRFLRRPWEVDRSVIITDGRTDGRWVPYIRGAAGRAPGLGRSAEREAG